MMNRHLAIIISLALLVRLVALWVYSDIAQLRGFVEGGDAIGYLQLADNLLVRGVFAFDPDLPTAFRMPGYPAYLALAASPWGSPLPAQLIQIAADTLTVLVAYKTTRLLTNDWRLAGLAALAVAFNPLLVASSIALYPETLSICALNLATYLILRYPQTTAAGVGAAVLLAVCIYLKPTLAVLSGTYLIMLVGRHWWGRRSTRAALISLLPLGVMALLLLPWGLRNLAVMGDFIPLTTSNGVNLYGGNNPQADGGYVYSGPYGLPGLSEGASDREYTRRAVTWITSHPAGFVGLLLPKAARFLWPLSLGTSGYIDVPWAVSFAVLVATVAVYGGAISGAWRLAVTGRRLEACVLLAPLSLLLLTSLGTFGAARFSLPAFPALAVLMAVGVGVVLPAQLARAGPDGDQA